MLGKIEGRRRRGQQRMRWLDGITDSNGPELEQILGDSEGQGSLKCCSPWGYRVRHDLVTEQPSWGITWNFFLKNDNVLIQKGV